MNDIALRADHVLRLATQAAMETFDDGALVLRLTDRRLFEFNLVAQRILELSDGKRTTMQVARELVHEFEIAETEALTDTLELYAQLLDQEIIEIIQPESIEKENRMADQLVMPRYTRNPDVVLREEDEDGGLLFNPDTNQIKVLNITGLYIWKQCDGSRGAMEFANEILAEFEDAPAEQVNADVNEFIEGMVQTGFIGIVEGAPAETYPK